MSGFMDIDVNVCLDVVEAGGPAPAVSAIGPKWLSASPFQVAREAFYV